MADPLLRLDTASVSVQPGGQAQVMVTVTSASDIVEGYRLEVLGAEPSRWAEVVPPTVNVYPGEEASAAVVFSPPSGTGAASGRFPFGVKATSTESADASSVAEGTVEIGQVGGLQAKIVPVTSTGRWRGRHTVRLSNWGNAPAQLRLVATDPDATLGFYLRPDVVDLPIGGQATVRLSARARRPFLRGSSVRHPFQVVGEPVGAAPGPAPATPYGNPDRPVVDAALEQRPILTKGVVTLAGLVLVAALAGGAYAWTRPPGTPGSLSKLGTPPTPEEFQLVGSDAGSVRLRWRPVDQIDSYGLQHLDPEDTQSVTGEDPVNGSQSVAVVSGLTPDTKVCFRLRAVRAGLAGPPTAAVCGRTAAAPASPSPSASPTPSGGQSSVPPPPPTDGSASPSGPASPPSSPGSSPSTGGALGGGQWVVVATFVPQASAAGKDAADNVTTQLKAAGLTTAQTIDSNTYPALVNQGVPKDAWLSVVGPYASAADTSQDCTKVLTVSNLCIPVQPEPS